MIFAEPRVRCLIACTRKLGSRPCHRCLVENTKAALSTLGSPEDTARVDKKRDESSQNEAIISALEDIYTKRSAIDGTQVEKKLFPASLHPTKVRRPLHSM